MAAKSLVEQNIALIIVSFGSKKARTMPWIKLSTLITKFSL